jgi:myosin heavy subunit
MRDIKPFLLILLSIGLVGTWVYHLYDKTQYSQLRTEVFVKDSAAVADAIRDSLAVIYASTVDELDSKLLATDSSLTFTQSRADSLQRSLDGRMTEINRLRGEIREILGKGKQTSEEDMGHARQMIEELQGQVNSLQAQKDGMEEEKTKMLQTLNRLTEKANSLESSIRNLSEENASLNQKVQRASVFVANAIELKAVQAKGAREVATNNAKRTDKWIVSFEVQNKVQDFDNAEVAVVIVQPDRQILQKEAWGSGNMQTIDEGARPYTRQVKFDYARDERKSLTFSLDVDEVEKGNYTLELWHKGYMIGKTAAGLK